MFVTKQLRGLGILGCGFDRGSPLKCASMRFGHALPTDLFNDQPERAKVHC